MRFFAVREVREPNRPLHNSTASKSGEIGEIGTVHKCRTTDFEATKLGKGRSWNMLEIKDCYRLGIFVRFINYLGAAAYVKIEMPVLMWSPRSSILSLTRSQMDQTFWGVVRAAVGGLGTWGVHLRYPWPGAFGSHLQERLIICQIHLPCDSLLISYWQLAGASNADVLWNMSI